MPMVVSPRAGQSRFRAAVELVSLAGNYRLVERLLDGTFRVPNDVARRYRGER